MVFHIPSTATTQEKAKHLSYLTQMDKPKELLALLSLPSLYFIYCSLPKVIQFNRFLLSLQISSQQSHVMPTKTCPLHFLKFLQATVFRASNKFISEGQGVPLVSPCLNHFRCGFSNTRKKPLLYQVYLNTQTQIWEVEVMVCSENITFSTWLIEPCM